MDQFTSEYGHPYVKMQSEPDEGQGVERDWIFDQLPTANIVSVSRPDASDISPVLLTYTIEFRYKQFKWLLSKKPAQVFYLHFAIKKRAIIKEFHEKHEQVKEWLQSLGIGDHAAVSQYEDEADDDVIPLSSEDHHSGRNRNIPSSAALPVIRPALGRQNSVSDRGKIAMQGYLNNFLGSMDIANSREVYKFLEVSKISFLPEYGPKLKEDYVMVRHLPKFQKDNGCCSCCSSNCLSCSKNNWQKVWAVLKPGFLAFLEDPLDTKLLDIIVFDVLTSSDENEEGHVALAIEKKEKNPLRNGFVVSCGSRTIKIRVKGSTKVKEWVSKINDAGLKPPEGWCYPHRFGSFAPPRGLNEDGSLVQWFVDGQAAFGAIASSIEEAKSEIFITDWWLCPELYLRRPFSEHFSSRLDVLLEAKSKQGVQIYILLYKEVALALKINSVYSKKKLLNIHENIKVLRYPDHFSSGVYLWSHHEKIIIIDNQVCYLGGLDLCFGRYDTPEHKVSDCSSLIWPGKDYYNPRESEPNSWEDTMKDELNRKKYPRMPWHDVQCALWGPPCRDVARHFVQRWNYAKRNKAANEQGIPLLMPQHHMVIPHYMGKSKEISDGDNNIENHVENKKNVPDEDSILTPLSSQDIPLLFSREITEKDVINENEERNGLYIDPKGIGNYFRNNKNPPSPLSKEDISDMQMNGFLDEFDVTHPQTETHINLIGKPSDPTSDEWWETQERGNQVILADESGQAGPLTHCRCQVIRSVGQWSAGTSQKEESIHTAYFSLIEKAEHFIYIENQFFISGLSGDESIKNRILEALYRRIVRAHRENKCFRVIVVIPLLPGFQGGLDDGGAASVRAIVHWQYRTISRGPNSILQRLYDVMGQKAHDYISFYGLRSYGKLCDGVTVATNQVYVHSKVMIVDDQVALVGSANINDRSLLGSRDSEIGLLIEDKHFVESSMNGKPWKAGKFSFSLRLSLWTEHLGLRTGEMSQIADPVIDASYKDLWMSTAKRNTMIYQDVFACIPNDHVPSRVVIRQNMAFQKEKLGYNTIDLGIAPNMVESNHDGDIQTTDNIERLQAVRGHLVCFPLEFMCHEDLRPVFNEIHWNFPLTFHQFFRFPVVRHLSLVLHRFKKRLRIAKMSMDTTIPINAASVAAAGFVELKHESDFDILLHNDDLISVCGFGSLLSERSAKSTFPELQNFRIAKLNGFRRVFCHAAPIFFERGIAKEETKEISSLSVEPFTGETLVVTVFEIKKSEIPSFIEREHEFRFLAVTPEDLDGRPYDHLAVLCGRYSDEEYFFVRCKGSQELLYDRYGRHNIQKIWRNDILPCRLYLRHCVLAARNLGEVASDNFLDNTFLGDRSTSIRKYLSSTGVGIMEEEPIEALKARYGG